MTVEDIEKLNAVKCLVDKCRYFFGGDYTPSKDSIDYLYRHDDEFNKDILALHQKYLEKYEKILENITINGMPD